MFGAVLQMTAQLLTALNIERNGGGWQTKCKTTQPKKNEGQAKITLQNHPFQ